MWNDRSGSVNWVKRVFSCSALGRDTGLRWQHFSRPLFSVPHYFRKVSEFVFFPPGANATGDGGSNPAAAGDLTASQATAALQAAAADIEKDLEAPKAGSGDKVRKNSTEIFRKTVQTKVASLTAFKKGIKMGKTTASSPVEEQAAAPGVRVFGSFRSNACSLCRT